VATVRLQPVQPADLPIVQALNEAAVPALNSLTAAEFDHFAEIAPYFQVAWSETEITGFLLGLLPGMAYQSLNYRWFSKRYQQFVYIDRIVVAKPYRRAGVASRLYADLESFARPHAPRLACEVNVRPRNEISLRFHARCGFHPVGTQDTEGGSKTVSLMIKNLATAEESI